MNAKANDRPGVDTANALRLDAIAALERASAAVDAGEYQRAEADAMIGVLAMLAADAVSRGVMPDA